MNNLDIYEAAKTVPKEAQKTIKGGRLNGFTDINPMWRIRKLTELFGPCGIGWYYTTDRKWLEPCETGEVAAFADISLYIKVAGEWSNPIPGTGGSTFVASESKGKRMSDEAYKMAVTDAISVACKNLGFGAEIYWAAGESKYNLWNHNGGNDAKPSLSEQIAAVGPASYVCAECGKPFEAYTGQDGTVHSAAEVYELVRSRSADGKARCKDCREKAASNA